METEKIIKILSKFNGCVFQDFDGFIVDIYEKEPDYVEVYFEDNDMHHEVSGLYYDEDKDTMTLYYIDNQGEKSFEASVELVIKRIRRTPDYIGLEEIDKFNEMNEEEKYIFIKSNDIKFVEYDEDRNIKDIMTVDFSENFYRSYLNTIEDNNSFALSEIKYIGSNKFEFSFEPFEPSDSIVLESITFNSVFTDDKKKD